MTVAMQAPGTTADGVDWRALRTGFWVARRDGRHLGTLEHGRRWVASDAQGERIGAFRTFGEAQAAVAEPAAHRVPARRRTAVAPTIAALGILTAVLASASAWALTTLVA